MDPGNPGLSSWADVTTESFTRERVRGSRRRWEDIGRGWRDVL